MATYRIDSKGRRFKQTSVFLPEDLYLKAKEKEIDFTKAFTEKLREELGIPEESV